MINISGFRIKKQPRIIRLAVYIIKSFQAKLGFQFFSGFFYCAAQKIFNKIYWRIIYFSHCWLFNFWKVKTCNDWYGFTIVLFNFKILNLDCFLLLYVVKLKKLFCLIWQLFCFRQVMILKFNAIWRLFYQRERNKATSQTLTAFISLWSV